MDLVAGVDPKRPGGKSRRRCGTFDRRELHNNQKNRKRNHTMAHGTTEKHIPGHSKKETIEPSLGND